MQQISAIIPARNEEKDIETAVRNLAAQPEITQIIVVDDQSNDRTLEILNSLAAENLQLTILQAGELPAGWIGKNHALYVGTQLATGEWLLFTDADTALFPGAVRQAMEDARQYSAALVSYSPEQITHGILESALIPFIYCRLGRKFNFDAVNDPASPDAAANGQFILIRREAYEKIGGHGAVAGIVLEDVALARRAKQAGFRLHFATGHQIARTRMYRSFRTMWQGWTKNLYALLGNTPASAGREILVTIPWLFLFLLVAAISVQGHMGECLLVSALLVLFIHHVWYAHELRANRYSERFIIYYGLAVTLYFAVLIASIWKHTRGKIVWKGRDYSPGENSCKE